MARTLRLAVAFFILATCALTRATHKFKDMILTDAQYEAVKQSQGNDEGSDSQRERRNAVRHEDYRWKDGVIPYEFDKSFNKRDRLKAKTAMGIWSKYTCVSFRPARRLDNDKIRLVNGEGCASHVGMVDGTQVVILQKIGCRDVATILHEIGHAIGLYHTQSRPDRDKYLNIDLTGVDKENHYNFDKMDWKNVHHYGVNYDFYSIMHYGSADFGDTTGRVIRTKDPVFQNIIGNAKTLSFGDIEMVNKMYKCKPQSCKLQDSDCPGVSFVGRQCQCLCPGPSKDQLVKLCDGSAAVKGLALVQTTLEPDTVTTTPAAEQESTTSWTTTTYFTTTDSTESSKTSPYY